MRTLVIVSSAILAAAALVVAAALAGDIAERRAERDDAPDMFG